jgi:hypothetical protein
VKIVLRLLLLAVAGAIAVWLWFVLFPSPRTIVLKKISSLAAYANINAGDSVIVRAAKASNAFGEFAPDAEVVVDVPGEGSRTFSGGDEIRESLMGGFARVHSLKVAFVDAAATVAPDKQSATVTCTAQVTPGESTDTAIQELRFEFKKLDGDWRIVRGETVKTLRQ